MRPRQLKILLANSRKMIYNFNNEVVYIQSFRNMAVPKDNPECFLTSQMC